MPYLTKDDIKSHLRIEIINIISRNDDSIIDTAISDAVSEAKGYLGKFNLLALFGDNTTAPIIEDGNLKRKIKDIAAWYIVLLANPNINLELFRTNYEDAIKWLKEVQKGMIDPEGWIYKEDNPDTPINESSNVQGSSNPKQNHHF